MKVSGLDIIAGLEEAFFKIVQFNNFTLGDVIRLHRSSPARSRYKSFALRSYFVKWQGLYNSFIQARRTRWDVYWATLPFSSHIGANGWPGSGYSAFVYINAPRYKQGLYLLYDPPGFSSNLVVNGDFSNGNLSWAYSNTTFSANEARFGNFGFVEQFLNILITGDYEFSFDVVIRDKITHAIVSHSDTLYYKSLAGQILTAITVTNGHYAFDFSVTNGHTDIELLVQTTTYEVCVTNVSLIKTN